VHTDFGPTPAQVYSNLKIGLISRVAQNSEFNKMTIQNLANIFGPTLLGSEAGGLEDARAQIRVAETIITYSEDMFELGTLSLPHVP
jgi:RhoGAP domain